MKAYQDTAQTVNVIKHVAEFGSYALEDLYKLRRVSLTWFDTIMNFVPRAWERTCSGRDITCFVKLGHVFLVQNLIRSYLAEKNDFVNFTRITEIAIQYNQREITELVFSTPGLDVQRLDCILCMAKFMDYDLVDKFLENDIVDKFLENNLVDKFLESSHLLAMTPSISTCRVLEVVCAFGDAETIQHYLAASNARTFEASARYEIAVAHSNVEVVHYFNNRRYCEPTCPFKAIERVFTILLKRSYSKLDVRCIFNQLSMNLNKLPELYGITPIVFYEETLSMLGRLAVKLEYRIGIEKAFDRESDDYKKLVTCWKLLQKVLKKAKACLNEPLGGPKMQNITYVAPISGIDFVKYMAFFSLLAGTFLRPSRIIAASGGCMVAYMALMSDFEQCVELWKVNSAMFAFKPIGIVPRIFSFLLTGSLYKRPCIDKFINDNFIPCKLMNTEVITGFFSRAKKRLVLSSNMTPDNTELNDTNFQTQDVLLEHNGGQLEGILRAIEGTTNIPFLLPALHEDLKVDFGVHSPSPLTFVHADSILLDKVIYFSPIDVTKTYSTNPRSFMFMNGIHTEITRLTTRFKGFVEYKDTSFLAKLVGLKRFVLVAYTTQEVELSLVDFRSDQVSEVIRLCKQQARYRLYA